MNGNIDGIMNGMIKRLTGFIALTIIVSMMIAICGACAGGTPAGRTETPADAQVHSPANSNDSGSEGVNDNRSNGASDDGTSGGDASNGGASGGTAANDANSGSNGAEQTATNASNSSDSSNTPDSGTADDAYTTPFVDIPTTVHWMTNENADPTNPYSEHLIVFQEIERITGVRVEIEALPWTDYANAARTRLTAGLDLPDLLEIPGGAAEQTKYVNAGLFLELTELLKTYAPHLSDWYSERPDLLGYLTAPDGGIYSIASSVEVRSSLNYTDIGIRYDWIDKLGMQTPETMDELYELMLAFKNNDPNGNGEADEIPIIGKYDAVPYCLGWSYGLHLIHSVGWYYDADGHVEYEWISDAARDWVAEMAKWYAAGLFDPDFTAPQTDKYNAQAMGDIAGVASQMSMMYPQWNGRMRADFPDANWKSLMPVRVEGYSKPVIEREFPYDRYFALTKDCKDPALNIKLIDWTMASPEGSALFNYGREGIEFEYVDGVPILSKENVLEYERGAGLALQRLGANSVTPYVLARNSVEQRFLIYPDEIEMSRISEDYKVPMFPKVISTDREADDFTRIMADINTYREESILKFIMGATDMSEWGAYASAIEKMNIGQAIEIRQTQLDRYNVSN